ncbi:hypothetical protein N0V82_010384 [Gnomoniopsis sp. IMI 355080]|nr:hypothetical protein N0V82_010384 [Gnomoniopsis sp. IMI 355080]
MESLPSFQSLSSMAIGPVLMMNWRSIVAYFPAVEQFVNDLSVDMLLQLVLGTRLGLSGLGLFSTLLLAHFAYSAWRAVRTVALGYCYTKCSVSQNESIHGEIVEWITRNPRFQSISTGQVRFNIDTEFEVPDTEGEIDVSRMVDEIFFDENTNRGAIQAPLKNLLVTILKEEASRNSKKTTIFRPGEAWYDSKIHWEREAQRLRRPLSTVILDQQQKDTIIDDIRNFLTRSGVLWYQEKGLPLRLGYLFSGPPGTGKSSLAFALASTFGLPVYMINLSSPKLNDSDIENLFLSLPRHCVVLLEDVDATQPLSRDLSNDTKKSDEDKDDAENASLGGEEHMPPRPRGLPKKPGTKTRGNAVTLSGLLNAIDGVGASEGRILIMTTNHIESLDEALIRTGRADRIVTFTNATNTQARDMFVHAYTGTRWGQHMSRESRLKHAEMEDWTDQEIQELAEAFSATIRGEEFSPALIQQYFKDFRAEPRRAVKELEEWMKDPRGYRKPSLDCDLSGGDCVVGTRKLKEAQFSHYKVCPDTPPDDVPEEVSSAVHATLEPSEKKFNVALN